MRRMKLMIVLVAFGLTVSAVQATETLVQPTDATASSADSSRPATDAIDGSGLSDTTIVETGDAIPAIYPSHNTDSGDMWRSPNGDDGIGDWIAFELGGAYDLIGFHLWNYNETWGDDSQIEAERGIQVATVEYSTDNGANWTSLGDMTFTQASGSSDYTGEDYSFPGPIVGVTDIRFTVVSNFNNADRSGISEVRFIETDALSGAHTPDPAYGEENVGVDLANRNVPGTVSWMAPTDPNVDAVFGYNVYMDPNETKVLNATPASTDLEFKSLQSGGQTDTRFDPGEDLAYLTEYHWRVDAVVDFDYVSGSTINDANTVTGAVWAFATIGEQALVTPVSPALTVVDADTTSIELSVTATNADTYQWYKEGVGVLSNGADYDGVTTDTLTIYDVQLADEGNYYCQVDNNLSGTDPVDSVPGLVMTKRLIIYYPLDTSSIVNGNEVTPDVVSGYDMMLASDVSQPGDGLDFPTLVTDDLNVQIGTGALLFDNSDSGDPNSHWGQYATAGDVDMEDMGIGFTVELWMKWAGDNGLSSHGLVVRRNAWGSGQMMWGIETRPANDGSVYFGTNGNATALVSFDAGTWNHIAVTHDGDSTARVYVNGEFEAQHTNVPYWGGVDSPLMLAAANYDAATGAASNFFSGIIDDVKFYNYPRTTAEIAQDYLAIEGGWVCDNEGTEDLTYDFNGNCQVDLGDFAMLAADWLNDNRIYPN